MIGQGAERLIKAVPGTRRTLRNEADAAVSARSMGGNSYAFFTAEGGRIELLRDGKGRVSGFRISTGRVLNLKPGKANAGA